MEEGVRNCGIPFGGLGTGSVELRADGLLHEWQIMNNGPWGTGPEVDPGRDACYFGMHVQCAERSWSTVLADVPAYARHLNDPYHLPWLRHPVRIGSRQRFPFTELEYCLPEMPVRVRLEAFSSFVPLNARDSALPAVFLRFAMENVSDKPVEAALFCALRNLVGYSRQDQPSSQCFSQDRDGARILFSREDLPERCTSGGSMALGVRGGGAGISHCLHVRTVRDIWDPLRATGSLEDVDFGSFVGETGDQRPEAAKAKAVQGMPHGVLCASVEICPGESRELDFLLAWHFPYMWEQPDSDGNTKCIGHRYSEWFTDATDVLDYALLHRDRLHRETRAFAEAFYASDLPKWFLDAVNAQLTTLVKASWWDSAGRFGIWEGLGCCGLQTTDITHYGSWPIIQLFPEIQCNQMRLTVSNIPEPGKIPHLMPGSFSFCDADPRNRIDLIPQFVLLVWRDVLWTGDMDYAREMWPIVREALDYARRFDTDGDGLPNNRGPDQTYDQFPLKGTSAFVGYLHAAALYAAGEIAERIGNALDAARLQQAFQCALDTLNGQLWNGEYYRLSFDPETGDANEGIMADQVNADWFVRQATGDGLLADDRVKSALRAVLMHCSRPEGFLANCAWPKGGKVEIRRTTSDQANCPWSGVEYALAAHLLLMDMQDEGMGIARDVWVRYERAGLRFNHIECGGHYYRAMSAWAAYLACAGYVFNAANDELRLLRRNDPGQFVFNTPTAWGTLQRHASDFRLSLQTGQIRLRRVRVDGARRVEILSGSMEIRADGDEVVLQEPLTMCAGESIRIDTEY